MDSALSTSTTLFAVSKALNRRLSTSTAIQCLPPQLLSRRLSCICGFYASLNGGAARLASLSSSSSSLSSSSLKTLCAVEASLRRRLQCVSSSSAASFASGGGNGGFGGESGGGDGGGGGGGGGKSGSDGGSGQSNLVGGAGDEASALSSEVIILDVGGMTCGGCAASVKRILESQPQVSSATVNLTTETAIVWPLSEAKVVPNWHQQLGETLAKHLTSCGFKSSLRVAGEGASEGDISP